MAGIVARVKEGMSFRGGGGAQEETDVVYGVHGVVSVAVNRFHRDYCRTRNAWLRRPSVRLRGRQMSMTFFYRGSLLPYSILLF